MTTRCCAWAQDIARNAAALHAGPQRTPATDMRNNWQDLAEFAH